MHCSDFLTEVAFIMFNAIPLIEPLYCLSLGAKLYFLKFRKDNSLSSIFANCKFLKIFR
jgi:hypothetical protein